MSTINGLNFIGDNNLRFSKACFCTPILSTTLNGKWPIAEEYIHREDMMTSPLQINALTKEINNISKQTKFNIEIEKWIEFSTKFSLSYDPTAIEKMHLFCNELSDLTDIKKDILRDYCFYVPTDIKEILYDVIKFVKSSYKGFPNDRINESLRAIRLSLFHLNPDLNAKPEMLRELIRSINTIKITDWSNYIELMHQILGYWFGVKSELIYEIDSPMNYQTSIFISEAIHGRSIYAKQPRRLRLPGWRLDGHSILYASYVLLRNALEKNNLESVCKVLFWIGNTLGGLSLDVLKPINSNEEKDILFSWNKDGAAYFFAIPETTEKDHERISQFTCKHTVKTITTFNTLLHLHLQKIFNYWNSYFERNYVNEINAEYHYTHMALSRKEVPRILEKVSFATEYALSNFVMDVMVDDCPECKRVANDILVLGGYSKDSISISTLLDATDYSQRWMYNVANHELPTVHDVQKFFNARAL